MPEPWTASWADVPDEIDDDETLHRRVPPGGIVFPERRVASMTYWSSNTPYDLSVDRALYRNTGASLQGHESFGVCALNAGSARALEQVEVRSDKLIDNPAHANVHIDKGVSKSKRDRLAKKLAKASTVVLEPPDDDSDD